MLRQLIKNREELSFALLTFILLVLLSLLIYYGFGAN